MLEATQHAHSAFVTLTYSDDNLVCTDADDPLPTLVPKDLQDWLKRIRKAVHPQKLRYYAVGEYGDTTERPHYHVALFGYHSCLNGITVRSARRSSCCSQCDLVSATWGKGHVLLGTLEAHSASYVSGYVTKKLSAKDDYRLRGRAPEFCRMSLRPGLGVDALHEVASQLMTYPTDDLDVPLGLRHGPKIRPLGRYLRSKLRELVGKDPKTPNEVLDKVFEEMSLLREDAWNNGKSLLQALLEEGEQKVLQMEVRQKIHTKRRYL